MAALGTIGTEHGPAAAATGFQRLARVIRCDGEVLTTAAARAADQGSPSTPCLVLPVAGVFRFRAAVPAGSTTFSLLVKQTGTVRPQLRAEANLDIGLLADVVSTAPTGADWVAVSVTVPASAAGGVWLEIRNRESGWCPCYVDTLTRA